MANPDDNSRLEKKVDLVLALAMDERLYRAPPEYLRESLERLGVSFPSDAAFDLLRRLELLGEPWVMSKRWVSESLDEVRHRVGRMEDVVEELATSVASIKRSTEGIASIEHSVRQLHSSIQEMRSSNAGSVADLAERYASLLTDTATIKANLADVQLKVDQSARSIEEINTTLARVQQR